MYFIIRLISYIIIILGLVHISFAFPLNMNPDTLWFVGAGMAIIFAGLLNLVAIDRGGSSFSKVIALIVNTAMCGLFIFSLFILHEPQVYPGITLFLVSAITFFISLLKHHQIKQ